MKKNEERNTEIAALLRGGMTYTAAAKLYGITPQRVNQIARQYGVEYRRSDESRAKMSAAARSNASEVMHHPV